MTNFLDPKVQKETGVGPNLHFHTLPETQIYTTHIHTKPTFTQHQIYTGPKFTRPQIYTISNLQNPDLHKPRYTQPQLYTKSKFTQSQIYRVPNLQHGPVSGSNVERSSNILT